MNEITTFNFNEMPVRIIMKGEDPWFVANDACAILSISNPRDAVSRLDDDEKGVGNSDTLGGRQKVTIISEAGLYKLTLSSDKPEAKPFQRWVTHDVLPTIRKTGAYVHPNKATSPLKALAEAAKLFPPVFRIARLIGCTKNAAAISANQAVLAETNVNLLSMLGQTHLIAANQNEQYYNPTELGEKYGLSARKVNKLLEAAGLQTRIADRWEPTEKGRPNCVILDTGKRHNSGVPITQPKWVPSVMELLAIPEAA